jgi:ferritin-like metal-binding protein YciE
MVILRPNIAGIDREIERLQKVIDTLPYTDIWVYGRMYKNLTKEGSYIAETYTKEGEYRDVFIDDTKGGVIGVLIESRTAISRSVRKAKIHVIFTLRLDKISGKVERYDEEIISEASEILETNGYVVDDIRVGVQEVFTGYEIERYKFRDMQPNLVFSIGTELSYNNDKKCN